MRDFFALFFIFSVIGFTYGKDIEGDFVAPEDSVDIGALATRDQPLTISGSLKATGGLSYGWTDWPRLDDLNYAYDLYAGYTLTATLNMDARPDPDFRVYGSVSSTLPTATSFSWSTFAIGELFVDYTFLQKAFFRVGKYSGTLGGGPNNLIANYVDGLSLKTAFPLGGAQVSAYILARDGWLETDIVDWQALGAALSLDGSLGPLSLGLSGFYQRDSEKALDLWTKTVLVGIDISGAVTLYYSTLGQVAPKFYIGAFWEGLKPKLRVDASYTYDGRTVGGTDHTVTAKAALSDIPGTGIKPGISWNHTFYDQSGNILLGVKVPIAAHLESTLGVAVTYGATGTRYVISNEDPRLRRVLGGMTLELSGVW